MLLLPACVSFGFRISDLCFCGVLRQEESGILVIPVALNQSELDSWEQDCVIQQQQQEKELAVRQQQQQQRDCSLLDAVQWTPPRALQRRTGNESFHEDNDDGSAHLRRVTLPMQPPSPALPPQPAGVLGVLNLFTGRSVVRLPNNFPPVAVEMEGVPGSSATSSNITAVAFNEARSEIYTGHADGGVHTFRANGPAYPYCASAFCCSRSSTIEPDAERD